MAKTKLTERVIRNLASERSFERGQSYLQDGAVSPLIQRDETLTAQVEGGEYDPYAVSIRLHQGGVATAHCNCAYDWGGYCKHIVAVLLSYVRHPQAQEVEQRAPIADLLAGLDADQMRALWSKRLGMDPGLAEWIEAELALAQASAPVADSAPAPDSPPASGVVPLARWLRERAAGLGQAELALEAAQAAFLGSLDLEDYQSVQDFAGDDWERVRPGLLDHLAAAQHAFERTEIYLHEGMVAEAVQSIDDKRSYTTDDVLMRAAQAAVATHPPRLGDSEMPPAGRVHHGWRQGQVL